jgi:hypothetical protein
MSPSVTVERRKLEKPARLSAPKPKPRQKPKAVALAPDPFAGLERIGSFLILGVDRTGKRTLTRCNCGVVCEISTEAIRTGERRSCGNCGARRQTGAESFAEAVVAAERYVAVSRHKGRR